jgi:hypothetical protein
MYIRHVLYVYIIASHLGLVNGFFQGSRLGGGVPCNIHVGAKSFIKIIVDSVYNMCYYDGAHNFIRRGAGAVPAETA